MDSDEFRAAKAKAMTEAELAVEVAALCGVYRVYRYHTYDSRRSEAGFPDETLIGTRVLFRELKRVGKVPTAAQVRVLRALRDAGQDADVWTPADLFAGRVRDQIQAVSLRVGTPRR